jgi:hypothetical protein
MANQVKQSRRSVLSGPSAGVLAWTTYWMGVVDWLIDARRRWYGCNPGPSSRSRSLHLIAACAPCATLVLLALRVL